MYIEPCCIDRELPQLLKGQSFSFFQSSGDWTVRDLLKSVSVLVENNIVWLAAMSVDAYLLRDLCHYIERGWYKHVVLITGEGQQALIEEIVAPVREHFTWVLSRRVMDGVLALTNGEQHLLIQGPALLEKDFSLCQYAAYYGKDPEPFMSGLEALASMVKTSLFQPVEEPLVQAVLNKQLKALNEG